MKRIIFRPPPCCFRDWPDVIEHAVRVRLTTLVTGHQETRFIRLVDGTDPVVRSARVELDRPFLSPVAAYLVDHPNHGSFLIDTGLDDSFSRRPYGGLRGPLTRFVIAPYRQEPGEGLNSRLRALARPIEAVFFTHLHFDHTAGLAALPPAIRCLGGRAETQLNYWPLLYSDDGGLILTFEELSFQKSPDMPPVGPAIDILGDGSVWGIPTPGHSRGHTSYLVMTQQTPVLIAGDAIMTRWQLDHMVAPGFCWDRMMARASVGRLQDLLAALPPTRVCFGHEMNT